MNEINPSSPARRRISPRRLVLMGSVAGVALAILLGGPSGFRQVSLPTWSNQAQAADTVSLAHPADFADLIAKVKPAVVSVRVKMDQGFQSSATDDNENANPARPGSPQPGSPMEKFFRQFGGDQPQQRRAVTGEGSGFFISADGYAVTNNHVVDHASTVTVTTDDGKMHTAKVVGTDPRSDLALIKVDGSGFPYVKFSDQAPRIGEWAVAVGNPFGLGGTVTAGIVSATGRDIGRGSDDYIQIDAPINRGNSGGPTFDTNGNVMGVNTAIFSPSGGSVGIGFDIPAATAKNVIAQLKDSGHVTRGWLGVQIQPVTSDVADALGLKQAAGALVTEPQAGSPAAKAGVKAGDVIVSVDGQPVDDPNAFDYRFATKPLGGSAKLGAWRAGRELTAAVALLTAPETPRDEIVIRSRSPFSGAKIANLSPALADELQLQNVDDGVVIVDVDNGSYASNLGFQRGDVIQEVNGEAVTKTRDLDRLSKMPSNSWRIGILRGGQKISAVFN
jgi:serine protease Do